MTALEQWSKTRKNLTGQCWSLLIFIKLIKINSCWAFFYIYLPTLTSYYTDLYILLKTGYPGKS